MRFAGLVADPMRSQQDLQTGLKRQNPDLARILVDPDRPVSGDGRIFLNQPLDDAGGEQHGIDIVRQCRAVMTMTVNALDGIAHVKSVKRHEPTMPKPPRSALISIKGAAAKSLIGSDCLRTGFQVSVLTRFLRANRYPPRIKSGAGFRSKTL